MREPPDRGRARARGRLDGYRQTVELAAEFASSPLAEQIPTERQLLALLKDQGLSPATAGRLEAEYDKRDRKKARFDRALERRRQVEILSRQGVPVGEIASSLGLSYNYVVQLRAALDVPRSRTQR